MPPHPRYSTPLSGTPRRTAMLLLFACAMRRCHRFADSAKEILRRRSRESGPWRRSRGPDRPQDDPSVKQRSPSPAAVGQSQTRTKWSTGERWVCFICRFHRRWTRLKRDKGLRQGPAAFRAVKPEVSATKLIRPPDSSNCPLRRAVR